jgi:hypothetical protein
MRPIGMALARAASVALVLSGLAISQSAPAQIGKVISVQGTAMVERAGQTPRILGTGEPVEQRDVISVAQQSNAMLEFRDQTRITLRPNTVFRVNSYSDTPPHSMVLGLVKGGLRAVTGDIAKKEPTAVRFQTNTAIIGVRGTDFDARLCEDDCGQEQRAKPAPRSGPRTVARVIEMNGTVSTEGRAPRALAAGAAVDVDDVVGTGADSYVVIGFSDGTRITLAERSELELQRFDYDSANPQKGQARLKLRSGTAHVWTGQLAKNGSDAFLFETRAGVIHPQGTGFSIGGAQSSNDDVLIIHTWDGTVIIQTATERFEIKKTDTVAIAIVDGKVTFLPSPPAFLTDNKLPRPDRVQVDPATFGEAPPNEQGLYVWVRDGAVVLDKDKKTIDVPAGSAALATRERLLPLDSVPNFMRFDTTPRPNRAGAGAYQIPFFRKPDGSVVGTCKP